MPFLVALLTMKFLAVQYPVDSWTAIAVNAVFGSVVYLVVTWFAAQEIDKSQLVQFLSKLIVRLKDNKIL